jgi:hypothetical protein
MNTLQNDQSVLLTGAGGTVSESSQSAVSWAAIIGGAVVAAAISLLLVALGAGLDLASISPWSGSGATATTFTVMTAIWFIVIQWVASGFGGYLTGRLRTKWVNIHTHEVFFRDTAHGFVTWALATVLTAAVLTSTAASLVAGGVHTATAMASSAAAGNGPGGAAAGGYELDVLLRGGAAEANPSAPSASDPRAEAMRILANGLASHGVPAADRTYLAGLVAARTGISQADAEQRVDTFITRSKEAADSARKTASAIAVFTAISMLIGAFIACVAAAVGGRVRDGEVVAAR